MQQNYVRQTYIDDIDKKVQPQDWFLTTLHIIIFRIVIPELYQYLLVSDWLSG